MSRYSYGMSVLGADLAVRVEGVIVREFDNMNTYEYGDVVYYSQQYWKATRKITPPWFPDLQSGEVPGESTAWRLIDAPQSDIKGENFFIRRAPRNVVTLDDKLAAIWDSERAKSRGRKRSDILGMFDLNVVQRNLNDLKPVTVGIARVLCKSGQEVISKAIEGAKQPWYKSDLPGETERKNVQDHLQWHSDVLAKISGDPNVVYAPGADLKKYVVMAYVDANAVEEGAAYLDAAWTAMWNEIQTKLAAIPKAVLQASGKAVGSLLEATTGVPLWAWITGGVMLTGLTGYVGYKLLQGPIGGAVASHYLGGRR